VEYCSRGFSGAIGLGVCSYVLAVTILISIPLQFGLSWLLTREVANSGILKNIEKMRGVLCRADKMVFTFDVLSYWSPGFSQATLSRDTTKLVCGG
jgi:hypothetical protein